MKNTFFLISFFWASTLLAQAQQIIPVDNFNNYPTSTLGESVEGFFANEATLKLQVAEGHQAFGNCDFSLNLEYEVSPDNSFSGITFFLPGLDLTTFHYLSFWVKGTEGGEYFSIELSHEDETSAKVAVWDYLDCGPSSDWQKVVIPLDAFWNIKERDNLFKLTFVFENFQSTTNGSPLHSRVFLDDILFGSHFLQMVKVDGFNDLLKSNATGANIGEFSENNIVGNYTSELVPHDLSTCDYSLQIRYNNDNGDGFGGVFFIFGGQQTGWEGAAKCLTDYDQLHIRANATFSSTNPGNVKIELKNTAENFTSSYRLSDITTTPTDFNILLSDFSPTIGSTEIDQLIFVFEENIQLKPAGTIVVQELGFRTLGYEGPDLSAPASPEVLTINGQELGDDTIVTGAESIVLGTNDAYESSKVESAFVEAWDGCNWKRVKQVFAPFPQPLSLAVAADNLLPNRENQLRIAVQHFNGQTTYSDTFSVFVDQPDALSAEQLMRNAYALFEYLRTETGVYTDAARFQDPQFHPVSVATTGMGLISICIADAMGWIDNGEELVIETLEAVNGFRPGFSPARNAKGWFRHFIDGQTGARAWDSEFSSIDSGILVAAALFCKKYFSSSSSICVLANNLCASIDWDSMIKDPLTGAIFLDSDEAGNGGQYAALPFNEYMIVAWLAKNDPNNNGRATELWDRFFADPDGLPMTDFMEISTLTDGPGRFLSGFIVQFCYFLVHDFATSDKYLQFYENQMKADEAWWRKNTEEACYVWGFGAGSANDWVESGYHADDIGNHPGDVSSPHIIGGAIPIWPEALDHIMLLMKDGRATYLLPNSTTPILWRFSSIDPSWRAGDVQGVDFASLLFGMAAHPDFLGTEFFTTNNDFDFPPPDSHMVAVHDLYQRLDFEIQPNPTPSAFSLSFVLPSSSKVAIDLLDATGAIVAQKQVALLPAGSHTINWNPFLSDSTRLATGLYFCRIRTSDARGMKKIVLVK